MLSVHTLGTGSGKPTPDRNVACTAVFRRGQIVLFDCGEGTQLQIARSNLRPGAISTICISHFHGDHLNGLPGLLGTLQLNQRTEPLTLIGPKGMKQYIGTLSRLGALGVGYPLDIIEIHEPGVVLTKDGATIAADRLKHRITAWGFQLAEDDRPGKFDLEKAVALGVPHGPLFGRLQRGEAVTLDDGQVVEPSTVVGAARRGISIAYCCDTSPCDGVQRLSAGVDLLVHEGTYAPGEEKLAHQRGHSSMADAARAARDAGVGQLVITHISQKYLKVGPFARDVRTIFENTRIADDLDTFDLAYAD